MGCCQPELAKDLARGRTHHCISVGARYRENEPEAESTEEALAIRGNEVSDDGTIKPRDEHRQVGS